MAQTLICNSQPGQAQYPSKILQDSQFSSGFDQATSMFRGIVMKTFTPFSFALRFFGAALVVLLTFNPSGYSYFDWVRAAIQGSGFGPQHAFAGVVLLIGWTILIRSTYRSLGAFGLLLASAFIGTLVWLLDAYHLIDADTTTAIGWIALVSLAALLAVGMSWSHIRRRLSGQVDVDDISE